MRKIRKGLLMFSLVAMLGGIATMGTACGEGDSVVLGFNVAGGDAITDITLNKGENCKLPTPTKVGYSFEGWYTNAEFTGEAVTEVVAEANATYYAKWAKMYLVTLELSGAALTQGNTFYLKPGENVYDALQSYVPTKTDYQFGRWLNGGAPLARNTRMPENDLALTAEYKVPYTVYVYEQNKTLDGYDVKTITEYAYVGEEIISEQNITGFSEVISSETVSSIVISETVSENVLVHYFNRNEIEVTFVANYPHPEYSYEITNTVVYGEEVEIPFDFVYPGYCLIGWSTSENGEILYKSNYLEKNLYGNEEVENVTFLPERDMPLYAVWAKGYRDMFFNGDYIYLFEDVTEEGKTEYSIYLSRGGVFFKGEYIESGKAFYFSNPQDTTVVNGKLYDNGTFIYSDTSKAEYASQLFVPGRGLQSSTKVYFDEYDGIIYSETRRELVGEQEKEVSYESKGTYYIDDYGYYVATFTEGELADQTLTMMFGYTTDVETGAYVNAFQIRNEEEYNMGELVRFAIYQNTLTYYMAYQIYLDGFGTAYMFTDDQGNYQTYYYTYYAQSKLLTLKDSSNTVVATAFISEETVNGAEVKGYTLYTEKYDVAHVFAGGSIQMDGMYTIVYKKNDGTTIKGYYSVTTSAFGGDIVDFVGDDGVSYKFIITERTIELPNMGQPLTYYDVEQKNANYKEYYYKDVEAVWYGPVITVNDPEEGKAILYAFTPSRTYEEISRGSIVFNEETGLYTYTAEEYKTPEVEVNVSPIDLSKVQTMVCALDESATMYAIHYWYSYTTEEGTVTSDAYYTSSLSDNATLTLVSGVAILRKDGMLITGQYVYDEKTGLTVIQTAMGANVYVKLDDENNKFVTLEYTPYSAYLLDKDGNTFVKTEYLKFDGLGGVIYVVETKEGDEKVTTTYVGTLEKLAETTIHGMEIYKFSAEATETTAAVEFKFIQLATGSTRLFAKFNSEYKTVYYSEKYGKLELDGYGYYATYKDVEGNEYYSKYYIDKENEITFVVDDVNRYFDLQEDGSFTLRGIEFGTYIQTKNQYFENLYYELDGYGNLVVYTFVEGENGSAERKDVDVNGRYERDGYDFTLTFEMDDQQKTLYGQLGVYGDYLVFIEKVESQIAQTYVNSKDLSVLILDDLGNAVRHTKTGVKEYGYYTLITDSMLYYMNEAGTDACIYNFYVETGVAEMLNFKQRLYYTEDLESLIFTQYGFAVFGGSQRYYYNIDENYNVFIYREALEGENHNSYGFVEEEFGAYNAQVEYNGKTYYKTDGASIVFKRGESTAFYPIKGGENSSMKGEIELLSFAPTGDGEFVVAGTVKIGGKDYSCVVTRKIVEVNGENQAELYFTIGAYRVDFEVEYKGDQEDGENANSYKITRMRQVYNTYAYSYAYIRYFYEMFGGTELANTVENTYGVISIVRDVDVEGNVGETFAEVEFYKDTKYYNTNGNRIDGGTFAIYDMDGERVSIDNLKISNENGTYLYALYIESEGYTFKFYFAIGYIGNTLAYQVQALTREEVLMSGEYTLTMETVIASDVGYATGAFYRLIFEKGEGETAEKIEGQAWYEQNGVTYFIVREKDENGKILSTKFYKFNLKKDIKDSLENPEEGEESEEETQNQQKGENPVPVYLSFTVEVETITTIYAENGEDYVDVNDVTGKVMLLTVEGTSWIVQDSAYDGETKTYTIELSKATRYTAKVETGKDGKSYVIIEKMVAVEKEET